MDQLVEMADNSRTLDHLIQARDHEALLAIIKDSERSAQIDAFVALWNLGDAGAVSALMKALYFDDENILYYAAFILGQIGDPRATEALMILAYHDSDFIAATAIDSLGKLGDPRAAETIIKRMVTLDLARVIKAAEVQGHLGNPVAIKPLSHMLSDRRLGVADVVKESLMKLGANDLYDRNIDLLNNGATMNDKLESMRTLGQWGDPRAVNTILSYFNERHAEELYQEAAQAVMDIGDPRGIQHLKHIHNQSTRPVIKTSIKHAIAREEILEEARKRLAERD